MKRSFVFALAVVLFGACSTQERDFQTPIQDDVVFYASFEQPSDIDTRVYANEDLHLRWTADDRVSIFNKITYNQQYKFTGETGDNAGGFQKVDSDEFVTGNDITHVVSVYPYLETTKITESEVLTINLPAEQSYAENSFGLGANTMVSVSSDNVLQYKNVGGYLMLKLYGDGVSVSSITLKGNNGEKLAGKASVTMPLNGIPSTEMASDATTEITLVCETPVLLGATAEESSEFWFVVPPVAFSNGFSIRINQTGGSLEKTTFKSISIDRNKLSKMSPLEVERLPVSNVIYYTSSNGELVTPYSTEGFGANLVSNTYINGLGRIVFDGIVTSINNYAFFNCTSLTSIVIPDSVTTLEGAFLGCAGLVDVVIPESVTEIGPNSFSGTNLPSITIPNSVTYIGDAAFSGCAFTSVSIPNSVTSISSYSFCYCPNLTSVTIPEGTTSIGREAFANCPKLSAIIIPQSVTSIGAAAFSHCNGLTSITVLPVMPPAGGSDMFYSTTNCPIYVPYGRVDAYKIADYWSVYANRIQAFTSSSVPVPEAVDLGLPSGIKWASFNLGASTPEGYGDYYAWGETEPYYSSQDPLIWKDGKEEGYTWWSSYRWCMGSEYTMTKYCQRSDRGYNGFTDEKTVLDPEDDAAHVNLGGKWRMPTDVEFDELEKNCTITWTTQNGVNGRLFTGSNGNSIFLPAAGSRSGTKLSDLGTHALYWSSTIDMYNPQEALDLNFISDGDLWNRCPRCIGFSVRPVLGDRIHPESVSLNISSLSLYVNSTVSSLTATVLPANAAEQGVSWSSSNTSVATVSPTGVVTSIALGTAIITATTFDGGKTATCRVIVKETPSSLEAVDLGLPSGIKWASFNLGASTPEGYGDYYAWGETEPYYSSQDPLIWKDGKEAGYAWNSYKWCMGSGTTLTKYCTNSSYGYNCYEDGKTVLDLVDDAAHVNLGGKWRMPTDAELDELMSNCTSTFATLNEVNGSLFTGSNGNSIFLPVAGYRSGTKLFAGSDDSIGIYRSSSLSTSYQVCAITMWFERDYLDGKTDAYSRYHGYSVRPVYDE